MTLEQLNLNLELVGEQEAVERKGNLELEAEFKEDCLTNAKYMRYVYIA